MSYFDLFLDAVSIVWRYKFLWLFGLISLIFFSSFSNFQASPVVELSPDRNFVGVDTFVVSDLSPLATGISAPTASAAVVTILVGSVLVILSLFAQTSLISATTRHLKNEVVTIQDSIRGGRQFFKPVLLISIFIIVPFSVVSLILSVQFIAALKQNDSSLILIGLFYYLVALLIMSVYWFALRGVVMKGLGTRAAIADAWKFVRAHLRKLIVIGILLSALTFAYSSLVNLVTTRLLGGNLPVLAMLFNVIQFGLYTPSQILSSVAIAVVGLILSSPFSAYYSVVLTVAYFRLEKLEFVNKSKRR